MRRDVVLHRAGRAAAVLTIGLVGAGCGVFPGQPAPPASTSASSPGPAPSTSASSTGPTGPASSGSAAPSPGPSAPAGPALASGTFTVKGTYTPKRLQMRLDIVELKRRGDLLDLTAHLTNLEQDQSQDHRWQVGSRFGGTYRKDLGSSSGTFSGLVLTDRAGKKRYLVAADSAQACVCTDQLSSTFVDAGETVELGATYAAPPTSTTRLDVTVASLGTFRDLPIS